MGNMISNQWVDHTFRQTHIEEIFVDANLLDKADRMDLVSFAVLPHTP